MVTIPTLRSCSLLMAILCLGVITGCGSGDGPISVQDDSVRGAAGLELVWADEFDEGTRPSVENWNIETGYGVGDTGWGNDEWQLYTDSPDNVRVENGNLVIAARCDSGVCGKRDGTITSARINSKDKVEVKFGKIQARIKMPPGKGMWPAFWMLGADFPERNWPGVGEIDIVEMHQFYSDAFTTHFTTHWSGAKYDVDERPTCSSPANDTATESQNCQTRFKKLDAPLSDDYHVYELDWNAERILGLIDGQVYFTLAIDPYDLQQTPNGAILPEYMDEFLNRFFMIANVAVGGTLGGPPAADIQWPQVMMVDWIRVYQQPEGMEAELFSGSAEKDLQVTKVINSAIFGGSPVVTNVKSTAVAPLDGDTVIEADFQNANTFFSGTAFVLNYADLSDYNTLTFSVNPSQFPDFQSVSVELVDRRNTGDAVGKVSVPLSNYTPVATEGDWQTYEIPLSDFVGVELSGVKMFGFWNPVTSTNAVGSGKLFFDRVRFEAQPCTTPGEVAFNATEFPAGATRATISVSDACAAGKQVVVLAENGEDQIGVGLELDAAGQGSAQITFGATSDADSSLAISEGDVLSLQYEDAQGSVQSGTASIQASGSVPATLGIYSETHTAATLPYVQIIDAGVSFGGNSTPVNTNSTAVAPFDGSTVLAATYNDSGVNYGGFVFNFGSAPFPPNPTTGRDVSAYPYLKFALDTSGMPSYADIVVQLEDGSVAPNVFLSNYTPTMSGNWAQYTIPVADFPGLNAENLTYLGFWNASSTAGSVTLTTGTLYFDDIHFAQTIGGGVPVSGPSASVFSESRTDRTLSYVEIIDSATFNGNPTPVDPASTAVTPLDGSAVLAATYIDNGADYGGFLFNFSPDPLPADPTVGKDVSAYTYLKFGLDTSAMPAFADLVVQLEDGPNKPSVFLSNYTPSMSGNWAVYEIPLTDFPGMNLANLTLLGFWNASSVPGAVELEPGTLYFDDIHFGGN